MADSPSEVWEMISNLKDKSKTAAQTELVALQVKGSCLFNHRMVLQCYSINFSFTTTTTAGEKGLADIQVTEQGDGT